MNENVNETAETVETEVQPVVEPAALTAAMDEFMLARYGVAPLADDAGDTDALAAAIEPVASAPMMANALSAGATTGTTKPTYTPHEWVNGADGGTLPLNAANLNEIEAGISGNCEAIGSIIDDVNELRDSQSQADHDFADRTVTNLLSVSLQDRNAEVNRPSQVKTDDVSTLNNRPPSFPSAGAYIGYRKVLWFSSAHILVILVEAFPQSGRIWTNFYNTGTWDGWMVTAAGDA